MTPGPEYDLSTDQLLAAGRSEVAGRQEFCPSLAALHDRPTRHVFEAALALTSSLEPIDREFGVRLLRELGPMPRKDLDEQRTFYVEAAPHLVSMLSTEQDARVLGWVVSAIGYQYAPELLPMVLGLKGHEDPAVRYNVVSAVAGLLEPPTPDQRAVEVLIELTTDEDADVRYLALSTLIEDLQMDPRTLQSAILARVGDPDDQIRVLAQRHLPALGDGD